MRNLLNVIFFNSSPFVKCKLLIIDVNAERVKQKMMKINFWFCRFQVAQKFCELSTRHYRIDHEIMKTESKALNEKLFKVKSSKIYIQFG